ncbi:MAG: F0F1 ATP synthase subunit delta [Candidatus Paceibacterota bacterium]
MRNVKDTTDALIRWCEDRGVDTGVAEFAAYMLDSGSDYLLPVVLEELESRSREDAFYDRLQVTSAQPLVDKEKEQLTSGFGVDIADLSLETDQTLLAGVSSEYNGIQIKDNLHGRLQAFKNRLYT